MDNIKLTQTLDNIFKKYPSPQLSDVSNILLDIQYELDYLTIDILKKVSEYTNISATEIYGYASFYSMYNLYKPGKIVIKICKGTACHVNNSKRLIEDIEEELKIKSGESTEDGMFKLETVSCLGVCSLSPVAKIDDKLITRVESKVIKNIIKEKKNDTIPIIRK